MSEKVFKTWCDCASDSEDDPIPITNPDVEPVTNPIVTSGIGSGLANKKPQMSRGSSILLFDSYPDDSHYYIPRDETNYIVAPNPEVRSLSRKSLLEWLGSNERAKVESVLGANMGMYTAPPEWLSAWLKDYKHFKHLPKNFFTSPSHYAHFFNIHGDVIRLIQRGVIPDADEPLDDSETELDGRGRKVRKESEQETFLRALPESFFMTQAYADFIGPFQDNEVTFKKFNALTYTAMVTATSERDLPPFGTLVDAHRKFAAQLKSVNTFKDIKDDDDVCTICQSRMKKSPRKVVQTPCGHQFHRECILEYYSPRREKPNYSYICPDCNCDIRNPPKKRVK